MTTYKLKHGDLTLKTGTLNECWRDMVERFGSYTVKTLQLFNIRIEK